MNTEILNQLKKIALKRSIPFCYTCYSEALTGVCTSCGSDDLMRLLPGHSCEYGTEWIVDEILGEELSPVDLESEFEEFMRSCYPGTTQVAWMSLDTNSIIKEMDPIAWELAQSEWISNEEDEGTIISFDQGKTYYLLSEIETWLQQENE